MVTIDMGEAQRIDVRGCTVHVDGTEVDNWSARDQSARGAPTVAADDGAGGASEREPRGVVYAYRSPDAWVSPMSDAPFGPPIRVGGYQVRYWKAGYPPEGSAYTFANSVEGLARRVEEIAREGAIRLEIVADDGRGNVVVGARGVNEAERASQDAERTRAGAGTGSSLRRGYAIGDRLVRHADGEAAEVVGWDVATGLLWLRRASGRTLRVDVEGVDFWYRREAER